MVRNDHFLCLFLQSGDEPGKAVRGKQCGAMKYGTSANRMPTTGEDETKDGKLLARQNVVHEASLFQGGKLGFTRAIILLEEVTEEFSNLAGLKRKRAYGSGRTKGWFTATANNHPARSLNLVSKSIPRP